MVNEKRQYLTQNLCRKTYTFLKDLSVVLNNHGRRGLLSSLKYLPIFVLRNLEEKANEFFVGVNIIC